MLLVSKIRKYTGAYVSNPYYVFLDVVDFAEIGGSVKKASMGVALQK